MNLTSSTNCIFRISDLTKTKQKVLNWLRQFSTFCLLDNQGYESSTHNFEMLIAAGEKRRYSPENNNALPELDNWLKESPGSWKFGHLGYDLKNEIAGLTSSHENKIGFADLFFFEPMIVLQISKDNICIDADDPKIVFDQIESSSSEIVNRKERKTVNVKQKISRERYIDIINQLKAHILRGDCYEINYCMEFFADQIEIDPVEIHQELSALSPNPFSCLYKIDQRWLICASPERFLKKQGNRIFSQPIKGTIKRDLNNSENDEANKVSLLNSSKDKSENVMIVDLVRNDLSRVCKPGTVKVEELFGVYSFPQVHQMISTISGDLNEEVSFCEIIRATFPMGSMTGAPKKRVMELIEQYEETKRGIFSGSVGYITADNDFDFNVVIRSLMYNETIKYLSIQAGSGITFYSEAEKEWEECLIKAEALVKVVEGGVGF